MHSKHFISALIGVLLVVVISEAQMAKGSSKFVGNITTMGAVRSDFLTYWNQITGENEHKWQSVEGTRNSMNWRGGDNIAKFAQDNKIPWKFHTLIWGSQYPKWMDGLSQSDQLKEITEWFDAAAARYPDVQMIDVVNEAYEANGGKHAPPPFKNALGGNGSTGFDYIIKSFQMARQRWPKAILIYNDYNTLEWPNEVNWMVKMANAMKAANAPMDAIGCQAHGCASMTASAVKANLDKLAATGYPIFITEYDIGIADDNKQKQVISDQFTMFWNHPKVAGITYWGYLNGSTWVPNTGLLNSNGTPRPSITWMQTFVKGNLNPPNDFRSLLNLGSNEVKGALATPTSSDLCKSISSKVSFYPNKKTNAMYVSNKRAENFTLVGKKLQGNSMNLLK